MDKYRARKIEAHFGPKRLSSKTPDGKALVSATVVDRQLLIDLHFSSRNVDAGSTVPEEIWSRLFDEIEKFIRDLEKLTNTKVGLITLPEDSPKGVWPLKVLEKSFNCDYQTTRRRVEKKPSWD